MNNEQSLELGREMKENRKLIRAQLVQVSVIAEEFSHNFAKLGVLDEKRIVAKR